MRIRLTVRDEGLRRGLGDLLLESGHSVEPEGARYGDVDLTIVADPADTVSARGPALLQLRPGPGERPDPDPAWALARALGRGGRATWSSPLDPGRLLDVLATHEGQAAAPPRTPLAPDAPIAAASDPFLLFDPDARRLLWANGAARVRLGAAPDTADDPLRLPALVALGDAPARSAEGRARVDVLGRPSLVVWWTDRRGRRVLAVLELPPAPGEEGVGNLRALAEIGRLSATLAHEVRNPMAAIAGALDLLETDLSPEERDEVMSLARQRLAQMKTLLDDTLRLARPLKGPPEPLDPAAVVQSAVAGVRTDPLFARIRFEVAAPESPITALGYLEPLRHALVNLFLNAAQAQGGVGRIAVRLSVEGGRAVLRIQDDGPGIPAEHREQVFHPFWTTKSAGTGLGLAFVRRVAEAPGGRIVVEDGPTGACFRLEIPLAKE